MLVKPKKGLKILRPDTNTVLMEVGEDVPRTGFWLRRLKDGDVSLVQSMPEVKPEVKKPSKKKEKEIKLTEVE